MRRCDQHGVLLIFDEVFAGFGRTGRMFAHEHFDVAPDIMTMAKGIGAGFPLGGVITTPKVGAAIEVGDNYTTYGWNNVVGLAAGLKGLEVIEKENLVQNAETVGAYFLDRLKDTVETYPFLEGNTGYVLMKPIQVNTTTPRGGYHRRLLRVDLTQGLSRAEDIPADILRSFIGGIGLGIYLL